MELGADMESTLLNYFNFLAGIALMLYAIRTLRKGADRLFGAQLRKLVQKATHSNYRSLCAGFMVSILTPSSTAVALLSGEAINAGYLNLQQVLIFMLGANVGFTLPVHLLAFKFYLFNSVLIAIGVPLLLFCRRPVARGIGQFGLGIGFLLLSIQVLSAAVVPLKESAEVRQILGVLENHPVWIALFATILKTLLQSATATIGIAIALTLQGVLPVHAAVAVVVGANIGIGVTAFITGYAQTETRRMALGNLLFKLFGAAVWLALLPWMVQGVRWISPWGDLQVIANAHTAFNVLLVVVFMPLTPQVSELMKKLVTEKSSATERFGPRYLDPSSLQSPVLALGQATREILHMADHVGAMLGDSQRAFRDNDPRLCGEIQAHDDKVDLLNSAIKRYLTRLSEQGLSPENSRREIALLGFANELENIGDIIDKNLMELAEKKVTLKVEFSAEGWAELEDFYGKVQKNFEMAVLALSGKDRLLAEQLVFNKQFINRLERDLREKHFQRLHAGQVESHETSAIHLDVLTNLKRINSHLAAVAYPILENGMS